MKKEYLYALLFSIALAVFLYLKFGFILILFIPPIFLYFLIKGTKKTLKIKRVLFLKDLKSLF
jgi:hypothetical protein